jgi:hypothetical protein
MEKFIATSPVRFDRDYCVGEEIPASAISPSMVKRLIGYGKIQRLTVPDDGESIQPAAGGKAASGKPDWREEAFDRMMGIGYAENEIIPDLATRLNIFNETLKAKLLEMEAEKPAGNEGNTGTDTGRDESGKPLENEGTEQLAGEDDGGEQAAGDDYGGETPEPEQLAGEDCGGETPEPEQPAGDVPGAADTGQDFICQVCGKKCASKAGLLSHMKTHEPEK